MPESWDDSFSQTGSDEQLTPGRRPGPPVPLIAAAILIVVALVAAYLLLRRAPAPQEAAGAVEKPAAAASADQPLGAEVAPIDLPPLDRSDALVRDLVRQLSSHPQVAAWLATEGLIRNFTVSVTNVAEGKTPARHVPSLRPAGRFDVTGPDGDVRIDPRSYDRYAGLAQAVASIDAAGAARLYTLLKPRLEEASAELGNSEPFDRTLERAIVLLLDTPIPDGPIRVAPQGATAYRYDNELFEALKPAQKQLLRMGPEHARAVQRRLREIASALNIPADRLPSQDR
jgi:hypothetical protein